MNNNRNGKEVHKGQMPDNLQKENKPKPVNRIKKKNTPVAKDIIPGEPKKIPLNINKNPGNSPKSGPKGNVIKFEEKDPRIHPAETPPRENRRTPPRTQLANDRNMTAAESPIYKDNYESKETGNIQKENFKLSGNASKWLLLTAVILFVAWAVVFFYYKMGGNSHMLLALAVLCAIVSLVGRNNK